MGLLVNQVRSLVHKLFRTEITGEFKIFASGLRAAVLVGNVGVPADVETEVATQVLYIGKFLETGEAHELPVLTVPPTVPTVQLLLRQGDRQRP